MEALYFMADALMVEDIAIGTFLITTGIGVLFSFLYYAVLCRISPAMARKRWWGLVGLIAGLIAYFIANSFYPEGQSGVVNFAVNNSIYGILFYFLSLFIFKNKFFSTHGWKTPW